MSSLFKKAEAQSAYLKMGIYGEAGSGKTYTASIIARGLALHIEKNKLPKPPVMFLDTETGASWVQPVFEQAGIEFFVHSTRSFEDLKQAVVETEKAQGILIADSMSHFWEEIRESYLSAKRKRFKNPHARLELPDWNTIKPAWGQFTTLFLNSKCHIILCGRAGNVYEFQENDETHKKEMITAGTRMAAEKGMGYEPNVLVEMTARQVVGARKSKTIVRTATILKDRSTVLDGKQFDNPKFENFLPHISRLHLGGTHTGFDQTRTSEALFPTADRSDNSLQRKIVIDEIQSLLVSHFPGQTAAEKKSKVDLVRKHFKAAWTELEEVMPLFDLRVGYDSLHVELEKEPSRYAIKPVEPVNDEIPHMDAPPMPEIIREAAE